MDSMARIFLQRARSELSAAKALFMLSDDSEKREALHIEEGMTFYSGVISHAYYSIFYAAKAMLHTRGIKTQAPEVHKKTYESFKESFVDSGMLDTQLLIIYKRMIIRADELLQIFKDEKWRRGHFTYHTTPQANKQPAHQSMRNATLFLKHIKSFIEKER